MTYQSPNGFSPAILGSFSLPRVSLNLMEKSPAEYGTLLIFGDGQARIVEDMQLLPCFLASQEIHLYGIKCKPRADGIFEYDGHVFKNFFNFKKWMIYF